MNVTLIDSPVANVANIARALRTVGAELHVTRERRAIEHAPKIVLPGVGSFGAARSWLEQTNIDVSILRAVTNGAALLGICVGHQLLFDLSLEMGVTPGLGLISGLVDRLDGPLPVPQVGWGVVHVSGAPLLFDGIDAGTPFYFVNSFAARNVSGEIAWAEYNGSFTAAAQKGRVFGVQFHPEKSSHAGLSVLRNFVACS